jgi:superfamily I DNA/RNA helicase
MRFPQPSPDALMDAASAIKQEYRTSVRKKRLTCLAWESIGVQEAGAIFALRVGRSVELDWTWEGAIAYRPSEAIDDSSDSTSARDADDQDMYWCGEVVEVDEAGGRIFVLISKPDQEPTRGTFYVRPYEFLALLHEVYNHPTFSLVREKLAPRLGATEGGVHPRVEGSVSPGMPELEEMWEHCWGILWGPPGSGKTYSIGHQVAHILDDPSERILVVSTTNKAVDGVAIHIGKACRLRHGAERNDDRILRIGKGVDLNSFRAENLEELIRGAEVDLLHQIAELKAARKTAHLPEERAQLTAEINELIKRVKDVSRHAFGAADYKVIVATAFRASTMLWQPEFRQMLEQGLAPFTTIVVDEAGLISRVATAVLSLLASRRIVLAGDPKQLAPISRMSRVLPTSEAHWLGSSGLSHLHSTQQPEKGMHLLRTQYRMHPEVCEVVSNYQYEGQLQTAEKVLARVFDPPQLLKGESRAIWYVLDAEKGELAHIRAERGPCNRSWVRRKTRDVLEKLFSDAEIRTSNGMFISPFVAQARHIASWFAEQNYTTWTASTVHSQQGAEADLVIFDTVNASSTSWPIHEWLRLVNVGLSRAREYVILLSSRSEMRSPYLRPLRASLSSRVIQRLGSIWKWSECATSQPVPRPKPVESDLLGDQVAQRKKLRSVLNYEQQRLCGFDMDGKPRLVRGVAGSGKTAVLGHWLCKSLSRLADQPNAKIWVVFANNALRKLLIDNIEWAWREQGGKQTLPWQRIEVRHIRDLLNDLLMEAGRPVMSNYEYNAAAEDYLTAISSKPIKTRCQALFVDEGQDLGPVTLKLLTALVEHGDPNDPKSRSVNIFYDNAQTVYKRGGVPKWSEMGLDMRGRSTVMKESFRSTRPITEFAFNVLHRLCPKEAQSPDHKELLEMGLVDAIERRAAPWYRVRFTQIEGPTPTVEKFTSVIDEYEAIGTRLIHWIKHDGVNPSDIAIIYMGRKTRHRLDQDVRAKLATIGVGLSILEREAPDGDDQTVFAVTPHSIKGYDSEIILIPGVEKYQLDSQIFSRALYVAMTRARSVLAIFGKQSAKDGEREILEALEECLDGLTEKPAAEPVSSRSDHLDEILHEIGEDCRDWLEEIGKGRQLIQEPILATNGAILCEPVFWYESPEGRFACFPKAKPPSQRILHLLEDHRVSILEPKAKHRGSAAREGTAGFQSNED